MFYIFSIPQLCLYKLSIIFLDTTTYLQKRSKNCEVKKRKDEENREEKPVKVFFNMKFVHNYICCF